MVEIAAVSEEALTSGLSLLVNLGKILLQNAQQEAAGRMNYKYICIIFGVVFDFGLIYCI